MAGGDKKSPLANLPNPILETESINVREKLAEKANVATRTYSKGKKIAFGEFAESGQPTQS